MSTRAQRRANKRNAQKSTGPKTDQGKRTCSQNALKHGLRSKHPVIPGEDPAEYQHKLDQLRADIRPVNALEDSLVEQIADTAWRLKRLSRIEAAVERDHIENAEDKTSNLGKDEEQIVGDAFTDYGHLDYLGRLARYEAQLSRRYHRAMKELTDLRKNREQTGFRTRPMEERDREEQEWRKSHPQPPADILFRSYLAEDNEPVEQTESHATDLDSTSSNEISKLHPDEALKVIEKNQYAALATTGQPGPQEAQK
jgi:hypothetical protein